MYLQEERRMKQKHGEEWRQETLGGSSVPGACTHHISALRSHETPLDLYNRLPVF